MPRARPVVVELAGLAGAGKSTLASALARLDPEIRARPRVPDLSYLANVPALVPTFLSLHWPFRGVLSKEMKRMLRVRTLHRVVHESTQGGPVLFDEGPVYMLARILMFGADNIRSAAFERWWRTAIAEWAATLDVVVWLEAPDDVLAARLHTRAQPHPLQGAPERAVSAFFTSYRAAFTRVLDELCTGGGPQRWTIATDAASPDRTARALRDRLHADAVPRQPIPEMA
jgi:energy-coupling factor transporter ATP-binding protein EcfA2